MNTFYSMGDSTVFLSIQVVCRNAEALGGAVAGIISVWLFTLDLLAPFFFAAALSGHWDVWAFSTITYLYHLYHLISHAWGILVEIRRVINQIEYDWVTRVSESRGSTTPRLNHCHLISPPVTLPQLTRGKLRLHCSGLIFLIYTVGFLGCEGHAESCALLYMLYIVVPYCTTLFAFLHFW